LRTRVARLNPPDADLRRKVRFKSPLSGGLHYSSSFTFVQIRPWRRRPETMRQCLPFGASIHTGGAMPSYR
jgi:hypothetical protein